MICRGSQQAGGHVVVVVVVIFSRRVGGWEYLARKQGIEHERWSFGNQATTSRRALLVFYEHLEVACLTPLGD